MAGGWNTGLSFANAQDIGSVLTDSGWTTVTTGGTTFSKGAWVQLIASTAADISWVMTALNGSFGGGWQWAYDIGIGSSGNEMAVASNLISNMYGDCNTTYMFPLSIKAGTRVAARASSNNAGDTGNIKLNAFDDTALSAGVGSAIDTYGFNAATNLGVQIDPGGTANTKGAYSQLSSSITNDLCGFFIGIDDQSNTNTGTAGHMNVLVDIAIGGSGSEKIVVPNLSLFRDIQSGGSTHYPETWPYLPIPIAAGTRVAARAQCSVTTSPDRLFGLTLYGVRQ